MKKLICILSALLATEMAAQNVGINPGGSTPNASSILDLNTGNTYTNPNGKGLLIPNLALTSTAAQNPVTSPATSLLVYNTATASTGSTAVYPGYYYWDGTKWVALGGGSGGKDWALLGNAGISTPASPGAYGTSAIGAAENFLGTTDANDVVFGTNALERMRIKQSTGNVGIGVAAPSSKLHISRGDIGVGRIDGGDDTPYARFGLSNGWEQYLANNAFYNAGTGQWNFVNTGGYGGMATMMYQLSGVLSFYSASNGANPVAWNQRMTILNNGNIGISASAPAVRLAISGNGTNVYATDAWIENNMHVQGNEALNQGGGRGRMRVGTAWNYVGLYADGSSTGTGNDLVIGASSGLVRVGCDGCGQNFKVSGLESGGNKMVMATSNGQLYLGTGTQGYGGNLQNSSVTADQELTLSTNGGFTGYFDMTNMSVTITPVHSIVYVSFSVGHIVDMTVSPMGQYYAVFRLQMNGATIAGTNSMESNYTSSGVVTGANTSVVMFPVSVTPGTPVTFKVQWSLGNLWKSAGTARMRCFPITYPDYCHGAITVVD